MLKKIGLFVVICFLMVVTLRTLADARDGWINGVLYVASGVVTQVKGMFTYNDSTGTLDADKPISSPNYTYTPLDSFPELSTGYRKFDYGGELYTRTFYNSSFCIGKSTGEFGTEYLQVAFPTDTDTYMNDACGLNFWTFADTGTPTSSLSVVDSNLVISATFDANLETTKATWDNDKTGFTIDFEKSFDLYFTFTPSSTGSIPTPPDTGVSSYSQILQIIGGNNKFMFSVYYNTTTGVGIGYQITLTDASDGNPNNYKQITSSPAFSASETTVRIHMESASEDWAVYINDMTTPVCTEATISTFPGGATTMAYGSAVSTWDSPSLSSQLDAAYSFGAHGVQGTQYLKIEKIWVVQ